MENRFIFGRWNGFVGLYWNLIYVAVNLFANGISDRKSGSRVEKQIDGSKYRFAVGHKDPGTGFRREVHFR